MSRSSLKFLAVILSILIVVVVLAGFDNLPRDLRKQVDAERAQLASARAGVTAARDQVGRELQSEVLAWLRKKHPRFAPPSL